MSNNVTIAGDGYIGQGTYNKINVMGSANSDGDIICESLKINGEAEFKGNIDAKVFKVNGDCDVEGSVNANKLTVNGDLTVNGTIECNNVTIRGDITITETLYAKNLKIYGSLKINGNVEADDIKIYGEVNCNGLLTGEEIYIYPKGLSKCKEIGATNILVDSNKNMDIFKRIFAFGMGSLGKLHCDVIEGDNIKIRNTKVDKLNGKNITLISKCEVENLEYTDNLEISSDSRVRNKTKVG